METFANWTKRMNAYNDAFDRDLSDAQMHIKEVDQVVIGPRTGAIFTGMSRHTDGEFVGNNYVSSYNTLIVAWEHKNSPGFEIEDGDEKAFMWVDEDCFSHVNCPQPMPVHCATALEDSASRS